MRGKAWQPVAATAAGAAIAVVAVIALRRMAHEITLADLGTAFAAIPSFRLAGAALLVIISYLVLTLYDRLALDHLGYRLPFRDVATASFTSFTMSHTLGMMALTGSSVRFRLYSRAGVRPRDIFAVIALCAWTFWLGIAAAAGVGLLADPGLVVGGIVPPSFDRALGIGLLAATAAYPIAAALHRRELRLFGLRLTLPGVRLALAQLAIGSLDLVAAAAALYLLLPATGHSPLAIVIVVYAIAMIAGAVSHAPGGIGVFETIVVAMLPGVAHSGALAALLVFRLLYTLIPFVLGAALLACTEIAAVRRRRLRADAAP